MAFKKKVDYTNFPTSKQIEKEIEEAINAAFAEEEITAEVQIEEKVEA